MPGASATLEEIRSQPRAWREVVERRDAIDAFFSGTNGRMAIVGCGTSFHVGRAMATIREQSGRGEADAFVASEFPVGRSYSSVLFLSRSGTTTEVLSRAASVPPDTTSLAITADGSSPLVALTERSLVLEFADESSVVQTRFATSALAAVRQWVGTGLDSLATECEDALDVDVGPLSEGAGRFVLLGQGWAAGMADEAALKLREAAGAQCESYSAMEYRHGPMSAMTPETIVWSIGPIDATLRAEIEDLGVTVVGGERDPMVELVVVQRCAEALARRRGRDPDRPPHLSRSVILT